MLGGDGDRSRLFAVPSSLVMMRPRQRRCRLEGFDLCEIAFSVQLWRRAQAAPACGASGSSFLSTRAIFSNSAINPALFLLLSSGVNQQHIGPLFCLAVSKASNANPAASRGSRVRAQSHRRGGAFAPYSSLLMAAARNVSQAASVTRASFAAKLGSKLADGCRLAGAVDAGDQDDVRLVGKVELQRLGDRAEHLLDLRRHDRAHLGLGDIAAIASGGERVGDR